MNCQQILRVLWKLVAICSIPLVILGVILIFSSSSNKNQTNSDNILIQPSKLISDKISLWPGGIIPYEIEPYMDDAKLVIVNAMKIFHKKTCIKFIEKKKSNDNWIRFIRNDALCTYSELGLDLSTKGVKEIQIGLDCLTTASIQRILGRSVGLNFEETRPDRDKYIKYNSECNTELIKGIEISITPIEFYNAAALNISFDYTSHMLNENKCLEPILRGNIKFGSSDDGLSGTFSVLDIEKLNAIYNCDGTNIDETPMYICRVYHHGSILIGKLWRQDHENFCWVSSDPLEYRYGRRYEVLTNPKGVKLSWKPFNGTQVIPNNAIQGGRTAGRQTLYIGRCTLPWSKSKSLIPSSIYPGQFIFKVPFYHKAYPCSPYEILVCDE